MAILSSFDKIALVGIIICLALIFASAAGLDLAKPYHQFTQMVFGTEAVTDSNGVLLAKYGGTGVAKCGTGDVLVWNNTQNKWICTNMFGPGSPPTATLTATPTTVNYGGASSIIWSSTNADTCVVRKNGAAFSTLLSSTGTTSGALTANPTNFDINCTNINGSNALITVPISVTDNYPAPPAGVLVYDSGWQAWNPVSISLNHTSVPVANQNVVAYVGWAQSPVPAHAATNFTSYGSTAAYRITAKATTYLTITRSGQAGEPYYYWVRIYSTA